MANKKFSLVKSSKKSWNGRVLFQIKAKISFGSVKKGELGGYIEKEGNLSADGDAWVSGNAWVYGNAWVIARATKDLGKDKVASLYAQTYHLPSPDGTVVLFKRVNKTRKKTEWTSLHDPAFKYIKNKYAEVENPDMSDASCSNGLHVSYATYWDRGDTLIAVKVHIDDIITIQEGKARCKKLYVLGEVSEVV